MRAIDGSGELPVPAYEVFSDTEVLGRMTLDRMLAGLSTRRYGVGLEPVGARTAQAATSHIEVRGVAAVRRRRPRPRWPSCSPRTCLAGSGGADGRRGALRRAHLRGRPRDRHRRGQAPVVAGGGLDRERHPGHRADRRAARTGPGRDPPGPGGARRIQGAAPRGARRVRPAGDRSLSTPQDQKCAGSAAGEAALGGRRPDAAGLPRRLRAGRRGRADRPGRRAGPHPSRRGGEPARGHGRDPDRAAPGHAAHPGPHAALHG